MASTKDSSALVEKLRTWRRDASSLHQYDAAAFVGDKILSITSTTRMGPHLLRNRAFRLLRLEIYFHVQSYARAHALLTKPTFLDSSYDCRYLAAQCLVKQSKWEDALELLEEHVLHAAGPHKPPTHSTETRIDGEVKTSTKSRDNISIGASLMYLRGVIHMNQNNFDRAKEFFLLAIQADARCYQAYDQLITNSLLDPDEELSLLNNMDYHGIPVETREFIHLLYLTKLNKYKHSDLFAVAESRLQDSFGLKDNADLMLSKANLFFVNRQYSKCLQVTNEILQLDPFQVSALPVHLCSLYELREKNKLFLLAHQLAESAPLEPSTWFGVGVYYLCIDKIAEARRYFSKSSMMDPHFGPAWIGFAHSFAAEGEHEQAISAYTTATRLFQGTHLPLLFLGMQHLQLNNIQLAEEYLLQAHGICYTDPLLLNELGVAAFERARYTEAIHYFKEAVKVAEAGEWDQPSWTVVWTNLGHACRKSGDISGAKAAFGKAVKLNQRDAGLCTSYALVCMILDDINSAITALHEALTISPADQIANELMTRALNSNAEITFDHTPSSHLDDAESLLDIRRQNTGTKKSREKKNRAPPRFKLAPIKMEVVRGTDSGEESDDGMDTSSE